MVSQNKILLISILFAMLLIFGCSQQTEQKTEKLAEKPKVTPPPIMKEKPKETIKLGFVGPLSGDDSYYGIPVQRSVSLAVKEINQKGGINGKNLELISEDGKCTAEDAAKAAKKLIEMNNVQIIIGGVCSTETLGMAKIAEQEKVLIISPTSSSPEVSDAGEYVFRLAPSDTLSGKKLAEYVLKQGWKRVGIINEQKDFPIAYVDSFSKNFEKKGGIIVTQETITSEQTDFNSQVLKLKNFNPDAIFVITDDESKSAMILKKIKSLAINKPLIGADVEILQDTINEAGDSAESLIAVHARFDENDPAIKEFLNKYENEYNEKNEFDYLSILSRDAMYLIADAIKNAGNDADAVKEYLYSTENWQGIAGPITIDTNGDAIFEYDVLKIQNGEAKKIA